MPDSDILILFESIPQNELSGEKGRELAQLIQERAAAKFDRSISGQKQAADYNRNAFRNRGQQQRGEFQPFQPQIDLAELNPLDAAEDKAQQSETQSAPEPLDLEQF